VTFGTNLLKRNYSFTCIIETNEIVTKMSFLNYHDCPWRATTDLVRGRVSSRVPVWLLALSRYASIIRCLLSCFDWTSRYRGGSSKMITTQGLSKTASSATLLPRASMYLSWFDAATPSIHARPSTSATYGGLRDWLAQIRHELYSLRCWRLYAIGDRYVPGIRWKNLA